MRRRQVSRYKEKQCHGSCFRCLKEGQELKVVTFGTNESKVIKTRSTELKLKLAKGE